MGWEGARVCLLTIVGPSDLTDSILSSFSGVSPRTPRVGKTESALICSAVDCKENPAKKKESGKGVHGARGPRVEKPVDCAVHLFWAGSSFWGEGLPFEPTKQGGCFSPMATGLLSAVWLRKPQEVDHHLRFFIALMPFSHSGHTLPRTYPFPWQPA